MDKEPDSQDKESEALNQDAIKNVQSSPDNPTNDHNELKKEKRNVKFKGVIYCLVSAFFMSLNGILIKKCSFFNGFEIAAVCLFFSFLF
jgi:hypothetical protein